MLVGLFNLKNRFLFINVNLNYPPSPLNLLYTANMYAFGIVQNQKLPMQLFEFVFNFFSFPVSSYIE